MKTQSDLSQKHKQFVDKTLELIPTTKILALGGSGESDMDFILVADKMDKVSELKEAGTEIYGKKISICPLTPLMVDREVFSSKVATMLYKGVDYLIADDECEFVPIDMDFLEVIVRRETPEFVNRILKSLANGMDKDKAIELLVQEIVLLTNTGYTVMK